MGGVLMSDHAAALPTLADQIRAQAAVSTRPGQLAELERIAGEVDARIFRADMDKLTLDRVADELGCTREQLDLWRALGVVTDLRKTRDRVHELGAQMDRVTDLFEKWAAEENEHRTAGEFGIAEGLHVAIEELRTAVHGKESADV